MSRYRIHFGYSKSTDYQQARELRLLAHEFHNYGIHVDIWNASRLEYFNARIPPDFVEHAWYVAVFTEGQIDFMAHFYNIAVKLPEPQLFGVSLLDLEKYSISRRSGKSDYQSNERDVNAFQLIELKINVGYPIIEVIKEDAAEYILNKIIGPWRQDMMQVEQILYKNGYRGTEKVTKNPIDYTKLNRKIRLEIEHRDYIQAFSTYCEMFGGKSLGGLNKELLYLKRLAQLPFEGRDLLFFRTSSSRNELIESRINEYIECIDIELENRKAANLQSLMSILIENSLTVDQMAEKIVEQRQQKGYYLTSSRNGGPLEEKNLELSTDSIRYGLADYRAQTGKIFEIYPDIIQHCNVYETPIDKRYLKLWTIYSQELIIDEVTNKGFHLFGIEIYRHREWRQSKRVPDFESVTNICELVKSDTFAEDINYTGRTHAIDGKTFHEIDVIRRNVDKRKLIENSFRECVTDILREAENILREKHGLPRIGEGWVSEMQLYSITEELFSDAELHSSPSWLKPQHLDVYIPSLSLAIEYQGQQHYEPVDFFGGKESFIATQERDKRKKRKCKENNILLVLWKYDQIINENTVKKRLMQHSPLAQKLLEDPKGE
jgi:hypothetical protein